MTERPGPGRPSTRRFGGAYQGSVEAVVALLIGMGLGWWGDEAFGTGPKLFLLGTVLGFAAMVLRIWRMRDLMETGTDPSGEGSPDDDTRR